MYTPSKQHDASAKKELRGQAGQWLRELREMRALSQRDLASRIGAHYTFISAIEGGRGRIAPDRYLSWANALEVEPRNFVHRLMSYYDPVTYGILFEVGGSPPKIDSELSSKRSSWLSTMFSVLGRRRGPDVDTAECSVSQPR